MSYFSDKELSQQEGLTKERFNCIVSSANNNDQERPEGSLIKVIGWAKSFIFDHYGNKNLISLIHNKIIIDGSFLQFCEENNISITPLHTDAITSWSTDYGDEHFVGIGIYKVVKDSLCFFSCGLFHKGNQNEDEVSFFIIIEDSQFEKYIILRNDFDKWQKKREHNSLEIEVIGGDPIPFSIDLGWDDLYLPDSLKKRITTSIDGFLKSEETFKKLKVPWRYGIGFWGERGCGKTLCLRVLMAQYRNLKPVTIQAGHSSTDDLLEEAFAYAREHSPSLLFFEDLQEMIKHIDMRHFLQLLDGLQNMSGILTVVTGNDFSDLEDNLKGRPRRFDRFIEFPLPDIEQSKKYLTKFFTDILSDKKIDYLAKKVVKKKCTYAHLQEIYFNSVFIAIPEGREKPNEKDVELSLTQVLSEKEAVDSSFEVRKRDLTDEVESEDM